MATDMRLLKRAMRSVGGEEEFIKKHQQYRQDIAYIDDNRKQLLKKYQDQWVAVYNEAVIASGSEYQEVVRCITEQHFPIEEVVIKYLSNQKLLTLF